MNKEIVIHWFRRDFRLEDNAALHAALRSGFPVRCVFLFDKNILDALDEKKDARVLFIHNEINRLDRELRAVGSSLRVFHGTPFEMWRTLAEEYDVKGVFANRDYEPYATARDKEVFEFLESQGIRFAEKKDHVIFDRHEVMKDDGSPYTVFTPYSKRWFERLTDFHLKSYPTEKYYNRFDAAEPNAIPSLEEMGFRSFSFPFPVRTVSANTLEHYAALRDVPGADATSKISLHLRFGTVSIRALMRQALVGSRKYAMELIWREFYQMILYHFPHTVDKAFKPLYDNIEWRNSEEEFARWCQGKTGFPLVDAGMRELNLTGYMHNRVRMVVASFLVKDLLIDWRWGERYFATKLIDFELASNVGGWQWTAGSGNDAAPYFRIFSPEEQLKKFDPDLTYVKRWVPEYGTAVYPKPMIDRKLTRQRTMDAFKIALT
jgi:deoxyribodipyrimidine photo-lyase